MASLARPGSILIGLGALTFLHYLPEVTMMSKARGVYWLILAVDVILGGMMVASGVGLRRGSDWAARLALRVMGIVFIPSALWTILLLPLVVAEMRTDPAGRQWNVVPRVLVHLLALAFCPYVIRAILKAAPPESRKSLWAILVGGVVIGAMLTGVLFLAYR